jgi:hypothetical protein
MTLPEEKMQAYLCHKRVRAAQIAEVTGREPDGSRALSLLLADGTRWRYQAGPDLFARYTPRPGDYLVLYPAADLRAEAYVSISPKVAFEDGYAPVPGIVPAA